MSAVLNHVRRLLRSVWHSSIGSRIISTATSARGDTAGIIVIGDEILRGDIADMNVHHLCSQLREVGISVEKVSIIPDSVDVIAEEVKQFSTSYRYVFTSGGVGPTHDDVTYEGIAKALGEGVYVNAGILEAFQVFYGKRDDDNSGAVEKFATVPESSEVLYGYLKRPGRTIRLPLVRAGNVYILPGVPKALIALFPLFLKDAERVPLARFKMDELFLKTDELSITALLNKAVDKFRDKVKFGSYPELDSNYFRVRLVLEAQDASDIENAKSFLLANLPKDSVAKFDRRPLEDAWAKLDATFGKKPHVIDAVRVVEEAISTYTAEGICIGFSGGKDCTVILHVLYAVLRKTYGKDTPKIHCFYMSRGTVWPEIKVFIERTAQVYNLDLNIVSGFDYKVAMQQYLDGHPTVQAFLLGNRSTDPSGPSLKHFKVTDPDWPKAMRVFPVLNWSYKEVWEFILALSLPYCSLYDQGFSSIGDSDVPNEALVYVNDRGVKRFKPAYLLEDDSLERCGRE
ncbi:FAD synthase-like [Ornithodoros turicata]|uniref:FAD synthase-like n=1 Tax=Ornithodoros turicata TaxID=34597 RepID=UPI00313992E1